MLAYEELTEAEHAVKNAIKTGSLVVLPLRASAPDDPADGEAWGEERQIRAQLLYDLLADASGTSAATARHLRLRGARVTGRLDLEAATLRCPTSFYNCSFEEPITLYQAHAVSVCLSGCHLPGLAAQQLETRGNLELDRGFTTDGEVNLEGARIGGKFVLDDAKLRNPAGSVLSGDQLTVTQEMSCKRLQADGVVNLSGAHIGGELTFNGAKLRNRGGEALVALGLTVDQNLICAGRFQADGAVHLVGAHVGGQLLLTDAQLRNQGGDALGAHGLTVGQNLGGQRFRADGAVRLRGAHIGGSMTLAGATLENQGGEALSAHGLTVGQDLFCPQGFQADGEVSLFAAHIGGSISFAGARLENQGGEALSAHGLTVDQNLICTSGFQADGTVDLGGAHIRGTLAFTNAQLRNQDGDALAARGITVGQNMHCSGKFQADGVVNLSGAHIGGELTFNGATLRKQNGDALAASRLTVEQKMSLGQGFQAHGVVRLHKARLGGLSDSQDSWPARLVLDGLVYDHLEADPEVGPKERLGWLRRDPGGYVPQPYEQLAAAYRSAGHPEWARLVLIAKQRDRRNTLNWLGRQWNRLLQTTVGYGYRPWLAGVWLLILVMLGWLIFDFAHPVHLFAAKPPGQRPWFSGWIYSLDLLLPFANLGYQDAWIAEGWAAVVYLLWNLAGWVLITAVVAALSGLIKRD